MLVMSRRENEFIQIGPVTLVNANGEEFELPAMKVCVVQLRGDKARIGIEAPPEIPVHRQEVADAIARQKGGTAA